MLLPTLRSRSLAADAQLSPSMENTGLALNRVCGSIGNEKRRRRLVRVKTNTLSEKHLLGNKSENYKHPVLLHVPISLTWRALHKYIKCSPVIQLHLESATYNTKCLKQEKNDSLMYSVPYSGIPNCPPPTKEGWVPSPSAEGVAIPRETTSEAQYLKPTISGGRPTMFMCIHDDAFSHALRPSSRSQRPKGAYHTKFTALFCRQVFPGFSSIPQGGLRAGVTIR